MRHLHTPQLPALAGAALLALTAGCDPPDKAPEVFGPRTLPTECQTNQLADAPTAFLRNQANSPIRWQNWTPGITKAASESNRLIFVFVGSSLYPSSQSTLRTLENSPRITRLINERFLPVLADADAARELSLAAHALASEIRSPIAFPFLLWLSPEGNPVAWTPINSADPDKVIDLFGQSSNMVDSMWTEAPAYVTENSARDAAMRHTRMQREDPGPSGDPGEAVRSAARRLRGLFDPSSGHIDGTGGLPPAGVYELLGLVGTSPVVDEQLRADCRKILEISCRQLIHSAMCDPLDGGIYLARRGIDWNLPIFTRDTTTQLRMSTALVEAWRCTGEREFLEAAQAALKFAEAGLGTADGRLIHCTNLKPEDESLMLWTREDLERRLDPAELGVVTRLMDINGLGNVPFDSDPRRIFFRLNVLGLRGHPVEAATALGLSTEQTQSLLDKACRKLLKVRNDRLDGKQFAESACFARHIARAASSNASMFAATGDTRFRDRATAHLQRLRTDYYDKASGLRQLPRAATASQQTARTLDYALTANACLDVYAVTLDSDWIHWSETLVEQIAEKLVVDGRLLECEASLAAIKLQISDSVMVFDDSSAGILHSVLSRLSAFIPSAPPDLAAAVRSALGELGKRPIIHTDALSGEFTRRLAPVVHIAPGFGGDKLAATLAETMRLTGPRRLTLVPVSDGFPSPSGLPDRGALLTIDKQEPVEFASPAELVEWVRENFGSER